MNEDEVCGFDQLLSHFFISVQQAKHCRIDSSLTADTQSIRLLGNVSRSINIELCKHADISILHLNESMDQFYDKIP